MDVICDNMVMCLQLLLFLSFKCVICKFKSNSLLGMEGGSVYCKNKNLTEISMKFRGFLVKEISEVVRDTCLLGTENCTDCFVSVCKVSIICLVSNFLHET